jgi:hypothetical protein
MLMRRPLRESGVLSFCDGSHQKIRTAIAVIDGIRKD